MLPKKNRLTTERFKEVFETGKNIRSDGFLLKSLDAQGSNSQFGVVVSKKNAKAASDRNMIRRKVYNYIEQYIEELPIKDTVVIVNKNFVNETKDGRNILLESLIKDLQQ